MCRAVGGGRGVGGGGGRGERAGGGGEGALPASALSSCQAML